MTVRSTGRSGSRPQSEGGSGTPMKRAALPRWAFARVRLQASIATRRGPYRRLWIVHPKVQYPLATCDQTVDAQTSRLFADRKPVRLGFRSNRGSSLGEGRADRRFEHPRTEGAAACRKATHHAERKERTDGSDRRLAQRTDPVAESRGHTLIPSPIDGPCPPVPRRRD